MSVALALPLGLAAGFVLGVVHFVSLERAVRDFVAGRIGPALAVQLSRLTLLGLALWGLAAAGGSALVGAALGLAVARALVLARTGARS